MNELASRLVFVDTSVYECKNFQFDSGAILSLRKHLQADNIYLLITDLTVMEIRDHIQRQAREVVNKIKKMQKELKLLRNTPELPHHAVFRQLNPEDISTPIIQSFTNFIDVRNLETLSVDNVTITTVLQDYFNGKPPFGGGKKKSEFPDAFVLHAVKRLAEDRCQSVYIISHDRDMEAFCEANPGRLIYMSNLDEFLDMLNRNLVALQKPAIFADQVFNRIQEEIITGIKDAFTSQTFTSTIYVECEDEVENVKVTDIELQGVELVEVSSDHAVFSVNVAIDFEATHNWIDYDMSAWDPEDKVYIFTEYCTQRRKYNLPYTTIVEVSYTDGILNTTYIDSIEFEDGDVVEIDFEEGENL